MTNYIYVYIISHKWSMTHRVLKSHKSKMGLIYMQSWKQCPPVYHHNGFVASHALGHMIYSYTLQVPMNQRVLNKLSKEHNIISHKWSMTHRVLKFYKSEMGIVYMQS